MKEALLIAALIVANLGGIGDVLGVSPGVVAGRIYYPNQTSIAVVVNETGIYVFPGIAALDYYNNSIIIVGSKGELLVSTPTGLYLLGRYTRSTPPYTVLANGAVGVTGKLLYPNGTLVEYTLGAGPLTPVALAWNHSVVLVSLAGYTVIARGREALLYHGVTILDTCGDKLVGVAGGRIALLYPNNTILEVQVAGAKVAWGETLDTSMIACSSSRVAAVVNTTQGLAVAMIDLDRGSCTLIRVKTTGVLGVALRGDNLTMGYVSEASPKPIVRHCNYTIKRSVIVPEKVDITVSRRRLEPIGPPLKPKPLVGKPSLVAPNIILAIYKASTKPLTREGSTSSAGSHPALLPALMVAVAAGIAAVAILVATRRFGGVRSSTPPRG